MNRQEIKQQYGQLYLDIEEILFRYDPVGINFKENTDEYDPEVDTILPRLKDAKSVDDVHDIVYEEFVKWFEQVAGDKNQDSYIRASWEIWGAWQRFSKN